MIWTDPTVVAAYIGVAAMGVGSVFGAVGSRYLRRESVASQNLQAQLQGWRDFASSLEARGETLQSVIERLEREASAYRQQIDECERMNTRLRRRVAALERRLGISSSDNDIDPTE